MSEDKVMVVEAQGIDALRLAMAARAIERHLEGKMPIHSPRDYKTAVHTVEMLFGIELTGESGRVTKKVCEETLELLKEYFGILEAFKNQEGLQDD
jgi:hypothetical protein